MNVASKVAQRTYRFREICKTSTGEIYAVPVSLSVVPTKVALRTLSELTAKARGEDRKYLSMNWSRLSEQKFRVDKRSLCRG
jgi:hypothetical protein